MSSRRVRAEEDRVTGRVRSMFSSWLGLVSRAVLRPFRRFTSWPDPTALYQMVPAWYRAVDQLVDDDLMGVARIGWSQVNGRLTFSSTAGTVVASLATSRNLLRNVPDEVHRMLTDEIATALVAGEDVGQVASRVDRLLSVTGNPHWNGRAQMIVTTEVTRASNAGAMAAAHASEPTLGAMLKRWNDSSDLKVRATHREVDGQERFLTQPFMVGGFPIMFPGDPTGPPHEVVSCRCDLSFRRDDG